MAQAISRTPNSLHSTRTAKFQFLEPLTGMREPLSCIGVVRGWLWGWKEKEVVMGVERG